MKITPHVSSREEILSVPQVSDLQGPIVALPIISNTGPITPQLVTSKTLLKLFTIDGMMRRSDHTSLFFAYQLSKQTSVLVSRVVNSEVLSGVTDLGTKVFIKNNKIYSNLECTTELPDVDMSTFVVYCNSPLSSNLHSVKFNRAWSTSESGLSEVLGKVTVNEVDYEFSLNLDSVDGFGNSMFIENLNTIQGEFTFYALKTFSDDAVRVSKVPDVNKIILFGNSGYSPSEISPSSKLLGTHVKTALDKIAKFRPELQVIIVSDGGITSRIVELDKVSLLSITDEPTVSEPTGDELYFDSTDKTLYLNSPKSDGTFEWVSNGEPVKDVIYRFENEDYSWSGTDLVVSDSEPMLNPIPLSVKITANKRRSLGVFTHDKSLKTAEDIERFYQNINRDEYLDSRLYSCTPWRSDSSIVEYPVDVPLTLEYIKRVLSNRSSNNEFAPVFGTKTGSVNGNNLSVIFSHSTSSADLDLETNDPDLPNTERLQRFGANPVIFNSVSGTGYLVNNLTHQEINKDVMSEEQNVRLLNKIEFELDQELARFLSDDNNSITRDSVSDSIDRYFRSNIMTMNRTIADYKYSIDDYDPTKRNNLDLVVEVAFTDSLKYIKVLYRSIPVSN